MTPWQKLSVLQLQSSDGVNPLPATIDTRAHRGLLPQAVEHTAGLWDHQELGSPP